MALGLRLGRIRRAGVPASFLPDGVPVCLGRRESGRSRGGGFQQLEYGRLWSDLRRCLGGLCRLFRRRHGAFPLPFFRERRNRAGRLQSLDDVRARRRRTQRRRCPRLPPARALRAGCGDERSFVQGNLAVPGRVRRETLGPVKLVLNLGRRSGPRQDKRRSHRWNRHVDSYDRGRRKTSFDGSPRR